MIRIQSKQNLQALQRNLPGIRLPVFNSWDCFRFLARVSVIGLLTLNITGHQVCRKVQTPWEHRLGGQRFPAKLHVFVTYW